MKKNAMLKIAAVLLVAVLLTTCAISSTFAKYVTVANDYTATARVANWGITSDTTFSGELFSDAYGTEASKLWVKSNSGNVIAPGTSGTATITNVIDGTSEVSGEIVYDANCEADNALLERINLTLAVNGETPVKITSAAQLNTLIEGLSAEIKPNASAAATKTLVFAWDWKFDARAAGVAKADTNDNGIDDYDDADLALIGKSITIAFTVDIQQTGPAGVATPATP